MKINPNTSEAYNLLHMGTLALARAEQQGIRVDMLYAEKKKAFLTRKIEYLESRFKETDFYKHWYHSIGNKHPNIHSNQQLSHFLYKVKKLQPVTDTESGQGSTDEEALTQLEIPELNDLLQIRKLKKVRDTYLDAFVKEQVDGYVHPSFNLHLVRTFRSCIAEGSLILVARDFLTNPKGIPIEEIKTGDYVYCFDNELNPAIQKVLWAGKTGHREVIRIHYSVHGYGKGFLDVTPEHKVRLIDGSYEQAKNLIGDFRKNDDSRHLPKVRVLSCKRTKDQLNFTGHLSHGTGILESRFIYSKLIGSLLNSDIIHHRNGIHLDHSIDNLERETRENHSSYHSKNASEEVKKLRIKTLNENRYKIVYKKGIDNPNSLKLSKFTCYRLLAEAKGQLTKVNYDFTSFKNCLKAQGINQQNVKDRYDRNGVYLWKSYMKKIADLGRAEVSNMTGFNYYKLLRLYSYYGINISRRWGNQFGKFKPGNHTITKIEWINKEVDVYDIEVEKYHNFFANEICVHNSSDRPNFQNIPKRDKEAMNICRKALFPRPGHQLLEMDFGSLEVRIAACYHKDPMMIRYITDPTTDMHSDMGTQLFLLDKLDRKIPEHKVLRDATKNSFVFPQFYGDYYKNCAHNLAVRWGKLTEGKWRPRQGIPMPGGITLSDHLISQGIKSYNAYTEYVKEIEADFWGNRFRVYSKWKEKWWNNYQVNGYVDLLTGFRCSGLMSKNDSINYPVQGAAFHCLLWSFIEIDRIIRKEKWDTKIISQVHDSVILDVNPKELEIVTKTIKRITTVDLPKAFNWIIVPLEIEADLADIDCSWADLKSYPLP